MRPIAWWLIIIYRWMECRIAKGISLEANGSGSDVVFNSVNVTGTDVVNGQGITVNGGTNYRVKEQYICQ